MIYNLPHDSRVRNPANAATGGINCTMTAGFEVNLATAEELPLLAIKLHIQNQLILYPWLVL